MNRYFFEDKKILPPIRAYDPGDGGEDEKKFCTFDEWKKNPDQCYNSFPPVKTETTSNITIWLLIGVIIYLLWKK